MTFYIQKFSKFIDIYSYFGYYCTKVIDICSEDKQAFLNPFECKEVNISRKKAVTSWECREGLSTYRGADKFLARPERKQATATKPLQAPKTSDGCPSKQVSAAAMTSASDENGDLSIVFSVGSG
jgi:hypothetical protein